MEEEEEYINKLKMIVLSSIDLDAYAVFLFGSRARASHSKSADFDIGVLGLKKLPEKIIFDIKDQIDASIIPFNVDIVDFYDVEDKFKQIALKDIQIWNRPNFISLD